MCRSRDARMILGVRSMPRLHFLAIPVLLVGFSWSPAACEELPKPPLLHEPEVAESMQAIEELLPTTPLRKPIPGYQSAAPRTRSAPEQIVERYPNRMIRIQRQVIQDEHRNYVNHGPWKEFDPQGRVIAEGEYQMGKRHGAWTQWTASFSNDTSEFTPPFLSRAPFVEGQLHGTWTVVDSLQRKVGSWDFQRGQLHGKAQRWYATGQPQEEQAFRAGQFDGEFMYWLPNGTVIRKEFFRAGKQLIPVVDWYDNQQKKAEGWLQTPPQSVHVEIDWKQGILEILREGNPGQEVRVGEWSEWHPNGTLSFRGEYALGQPTGEHTWWHENGQKMVVGHYRDGLQERLWTRWYANGQKQREGIYVAGTQRGTWRTWAEDGQLVSAEPMDRPSSNDIEPLEREYYIRQNDNEGAGRPTSPRFTHLLDEPAEQTPHGSDDSSPSNVPTDQLRPPQLNVAPAEPEELPPISP